jgi:hypothetical protein
MFSGLLKSNSKKKCFEKKFGEKKNWTLNGKASFFLPLSFKERS